MVEQWTYPKQILYIVSHPVLIHVLTLRTGHTCSFYQKARGRDSGSFVPVRL